VEDEGQRGGGVGSPCLHRPPPCAHRLCPLLREAAVHDRHIRRRLQTAVAMQVIVLSCSCQSPSRVPIRWIEAHKASMSYSWARGFSQRHCFRYTVGHLLEEVAALEHRRDAVAGIGVALAAGPPVSIECCAAALQRLRLLHMKTMRASAIRVHRHPTYPISGQSPHIAWCVCKRCSSEELAPAGFGPAWRRRTAQMPRHRRLAVQLRQGLGQGTLVFSADCAVCARCWTSCACCMLRCARAMMGMHLVTFPAAGQRPWPQAEYTCWQRETMEQSMQGSDVLSMIGCGMLGQRSSAHLQHRSTL
jgi:hypothetical protein